MEEQKIDLPPLPEADGSKSVVVGTIPIGAMMGDVTEEVGAWSEELVRAYAAECVRLERERAARVCESGRSAFMENSEIHDEFVFCAAAIRRGI